jgi:type II secretory pathway component PulJ
VRRIAHDERGDVSLTQLLVAMTIFVVVLGAVLTTFERFVAVNRQTTERTESQDRARVAIDRMAKDLRNLASPTPQQPQAVDLATPYDIVVQTVNPTGPNAGTNASNVRRVRYCLDSSTSPGKLWQQTQTWTSTAPPAAPSTSTCPATGWNSSTVVADKVVNGTSRPVFGFNSAVAPDISGLHVDLYVDTDPTHAPKETRIATGVFLRNQNRRPTADFSCTSGSQGLILNGSPAADPEGQPLSYQWWSDGVKVGTGIVYTHNVAGSHSIQLKVFDPGGLQGDSAVKTCP